MVGGARSTPVRERPRLHRRGGPTSFPFLARTQTFRRPVAVTAYDCATVTVIRDGSALLLSDFSQEPVTRSRRPAMNPVSLRQHGHADAIRAGCSHGVRFPIRERCSRSSPWLRRRTDQQIILLASRHRTRARAPIPRGNQPLHAPSPVPVVLGQAHLGAPRATMGGQAPGERVGAESAVETPAADPRNLTWLAPA